MKLDKAIEILIPLTDAEETVLTYPETEALKLGIEALKDFKRYRGNVATGHYRILPGETTK